MRTGLIRQPAGLGDIFFTQKIAKILLREGRVDQIVWPLIREYAYLKDYLVGEGIIYVQENEDFLGKALYAQDYQGIKDEPDLFYLPLQHADRFTKDIPLLQVKYKFAGMEYHDWKDYFTFRRNLERERYLENHLDIPTDTSFNLINNNFGSKNYAYLKNRREGITPKNSFLNIYMEYLSFDNIFDWIGLLERAHEIHTTDTSWCYILEKMNARNVYVYCRNRNPNFFRYVEGIFNPEWTYIL